MQLLIVDDEPPFCGNCRHHVERMDDTQDLVSWQHFSEALLFKNIR